ncbi:MAG: hypothetical protein AAGC77_08005 [Pseudomonadota bacterium]
MSALRIVAAFLLGVIAAVVAAVVFYSHQTLNEYAQMGVSFSLAQQLGVVKQNMTDFAPLYGSVIAIALFVGFIVAALLKRVLRPLATVAYPIAGATAIIATIVIIDAALFGGGATMLPGAAGPIGLGLQGVAGLIGGVVFEMARPKS